MFDLESNWIKYSFRLQLAALHYNENSERQQATDMDGQPLFKALTEGFVKLVAMENIGFNGTSTHMYYIVLYLGYFR